MLTRRNLVGAAALSTIPAFARPKLKIAALEIFEVKVNRRGNWILARIRTDEGLTGLGDASHGTPDTRAKLAEMFEAARGLSPFDVEPFLRSAMPKVTTRGSICAMSAIEQAMWDLQGKTLGVPCSDLFGGALQRNIRHYANINRCTEERTPAGFAASARRAVAANFDAIKLAPFDGLPKPGSAGFQAGVDTGVACVAAVREVLGPKGDLLVDAHSHFDVDSGTALAKRLEPMRLFWLEEVTRPPGLAKIDEVAAMQTAGGETLYGLGNYRNYLEAKSVDIVMPDVKYCGGMLQLRKAAAIAEGFKTPVSPHGPASPVGNAAAAQVCAAMPNFLILELGFGETDWRSDLVNPPESFNKGVMTLSDRAGLGIELNEKVAARQKA